MQVLSLFSFTTTYHHSSVAHQRQAGQRQQPHLFRLTQAGGQIREETRHGTGHTADCGQQRPWRTRSRRHVNMAAEPDTHKAASRLDIRQLLTALQSHRHKTTSSNNAQNTTASPAAITKRPVTVKAHTLDITPLRSESPLQKRSRMARVLKGFHSFTCTSTRSSAIGMSHTCRCLPSRSWYSFTDLRGMEGWVDLGAK